MDSINKSEEDLAYQPILRGIIALIVFSCLVLLPHIVSFANTVFMDYDDLVNEDEVEDQDSGEACDFNSEEYNEKECFEETKASMIFGIILNIALYSIPIYGFSEIYLGVSKLYEQKKDQQTQATEPDLPEEDAADDVLQTGVIQSQGKESGIQSGVFDSHDPTEHENSEPENSGNLAIILIWILGILSGIVYYRLIMINA